MAYVDDPNKQGETAQVAGSTPLSTGPSPAASETQENGSMGASTGGQMQSSGPSTAKPPTGATGSGKASSGQYTNIQKYVAKNQPQAQKMAGAVTQDVGKQAQAIRQQAEQKQADQQKVLQANQQAMQQSQDWATQQLQGIMGQAPAQQPAAQTQETQPAGYQITPEQQERFQALMRGEIGGVQDVGPLNIAEQQAQARGLQQMTGQAGTEAGRRQLLGQTFQKQGDYTRGMSGLDQLIVGGQEGARQALTQGVQQQGEQLGERLGDVTGQSAEAIAAQERALGLVPGQIQQAKESAFTGLESGIQETLAQERERLGAGQAAFEQALATGEGLTPEMIQQYISSEELKGVQSRLGEGYERGLDLAEYTGGGFTDYRKKLEGYLRDMGVDPTLADKYSMYGRGQGALESILQERIQALTPEAITQNIIDTSAQQDLSGLFDYTDPEQLQARDVISPEQMARYQALSQLTGKQDLAYVPEYQQKEIDYGTPDISRLQALLPTDFGEDAEQRLQEAVDIGLANRSSSPFGGGGGL